MGTLMQTYHLIATALFGVGSLVVAVRLLLLHRRTGHKPELFLGLGIGCCVLGYGLLIISLQMRGGDMVAPGDALDGFLAGTGQIVHNFGLTMTLMFVLSVFRPSELWAKALTGALLLAMWGGCAVVGIETGFRTQVIGSPAWLAQYLVIWVYPLWSTFECFSYYAKMRRRVAIGLADPVVVNRFCLWGVASLLTAVATWIASTPFAIYRSPEMLLAWTPAIQIATATVGLVTVTCYALTFFPPVRYAQWLRTDAPAAN